MGVEKRLILSVIVPVYNVAPYLEDCIESLMDQGLSEDEYEVIFVDDGSTDDSLAILNKSAEAHSCIKVVHQENAGVSVARNRGLSLAVGEYVAFVDGDDFLQTGALKILCDAGVSANADLVRYEFSLTEESQHYEKNQCSGAVFTKNETEDPLFSYVVWSQLVKRKCLEDNGLRFREGMKYAEDTLFVFDMVMNIAPDKQISTDAKVYCYRQRGGSAMSLSKNMMRQQYIHDLFLLLDHYRDTLANRKKLSIGVKRYLEEQMHTHSAGLVLSALRCEEADPYFIVNELKKREIYPYPFTLDHLKRKICIGNILLTLLRFPIVFRFFAKTKLLNNR